MAESLLLALATAIGSGIGGGGFVTPVENLRHRYHHDAEFHYRVEAAFAAVLALIQSEEAHQAIADGLHAKDCGCDGPTDDCYDELADAAQAALVAFLKEADRG